LGIVADDRKLRSGNENDQVVTRCNRLTLPFEKCGNQPVTFCNRLTNGFSKEIKDGKGILTTFGKRARRSRSTYHFRGFWCFLWQIQDLAFPNVAAPFGRCRIAVQPLSLRSGGKSGLASSAIRVNSSPLFEKGTF